MDLGSHGKKKSAATLASFMPGDRGVTAVGDRMRSPPPTVQSEWDLKHAMEK